MLQAAAIAAAAVLASSLLLGIDEVRRLPSSVRYVGEPVGELVSQVRNQNRLPSLYQCVAPRYRLSGIAFQDGLCASQPSDDLDRSDGLGWHNAQA
jgi:hypothetical protein